MRRDAGPATGCRRTPRTNVPVRLGLVDRQHRLSDNAGDSAARAPFPSRRPGGRKPVLQRVTKAPSSASSHRQSVRGAPTARGAAKRARTAGLAAGVATVVALAVPGLASAAVTARHFINVFPSRDFVHIEGYRSGDEV